jgi:exodeoxyribonuclease V alpha subunit
LLYTAVTRAQQHVRVIGTEESVRAGIERQVLRASGLRRIVQD